jgi:hypothetical protein
VLRDRVVPAFIPVEVARALSSLPLDERLSSGFHHSFLSSRGVATADPAPSRKRPFARRALGRLRRGSGRPAGDPLLVALWGDRPQLRAWLADEVLAQPALADAMGQAWIDATRQGFLNGQRRAAEKTQLAAGVFALEAELAGLARDLRPAVTGGH